MWILQAASLRPPRRENNTMNTMDKHLDKGPAYRQFWFWFVMGLPLIAVVASLASVYIAVHHMDRPVVKNAYDDGLDINQDLSRESKAQTMGLQAHLNFDAHSRILAIELSAQQALPAGPITLLLSHPINDRLDVTPQLKPDGPNRYQAQIPDSVDGRRYFELSTPQWRLVHVIEFPFHQLTINP